METNSGNFLRDIYEKEWSDSDKDCKKILFIMQENFKRPATIKCLGYLKINMDLFLAIMNKAYALIAVFQQIK